VAQILETAAAVLAEAGYEAATMTEIASRAGASIGAVYQYFPNKQALVIALRQRYVEEMAERWGRFAETTAEMTIEQMADHFIELTTNFVEEHPAYYAVVDAPIRYERNMEVRRRLREKVTKVFRDRKRSLSHEAAYRIANVSLQIVKSMHVLYADADRKERQALAREYKHALTAYMEARLSS
jgi:AcrR family transcriptional regulator